jgi:hypothetical protein
MQCVPYVCEALPPNPLEVLVSQSQPMLDRRSALKTCVTLMHVYVERHIHVCIYVTMHFSMHVCMYVCMYVCIVIRLYALFVRSGSVSSVAHLAGSRIANKAHEGSHRC